MPFASGSRHLSSRYLAPLGKIPHGLWRIYNWICTLHNAQQNISNKLCNFGVSFFCVFKLGLEHLVGIKAKCNNFYDTQADLAFIRDYYHDDDTWSCYQGGNLEGWHTNEVKTLLMCVFWVDKVCTCWQKVAKHKRGQINMDPVAVFHHLPGGQWQ